MKTDFSRNFKFVDGAQTASATMSMAYIERHHETTTLAVLPRCSPSRSPLFPYLCSTSTSLSPLLPSFFPSVDPQRRNRQTGARSMRSERRSEATFDIDIGGGTLLCSVLCSGPQIEHRGKETSPCQIPQKPRMGDFGFLHINFKTVLSVRSQISVDTVYDLRETCGLQIKF